VTKIFQAIEYFKMKEHENRDVMPDITGIVACTGKETFDFRDALQLRGKVEIYMQDVIDHIVDQQRKVVAEMYQKRCVDNMDLVTWYEQDIASPTIVVNQIAWCN
jgi:dynein heavy chain